MKKLDEVVAETTAFSRGNNWLEVRAAAGSRWRAEWRGCERGPCYLFVNDRRVHHFENERDAIAAMKKLAKGLES